VGGLTLCIVVVVLVRILNDRSRTVRDRQPVRPDRRTPPGAMSARVQWAHDGSRRAALEIDHVAAESVEGLLERFGQGGMGVDVAHQFVNGEIPALCECEFG
jgi:hypothetical protein